MMRIDVRSTHIRRALSIVGAFRSCMPAVPILSICRGRCAQEWRGLRRRRATIGAGLNRLALPFVALRSARRVVGWLQCRVTAVPRCRLS